MPEAGVEATIEGPDGKRHCPKCNIDVILGPHYHCPKCDSSPREHEIRNFDRIWRDGDVYCLKCGTFVRYYDAG
jgi:hypothetical protein